MGGRQNRGRERKGEQIPSALSLCSCFQIQVMGKEKEKEKKMFVGVVWNCAAELKLLLSALLFLCTLATLLQFIPSRFFPISAPDLRFCISSLSPPPPSPSVSHISSSSSSSSLAAAAAPEQSLPPPPVSAPPAPPSVEQDQILNNSIIKRAFNPYGAAAYNFIQMGAYRGGLNTFAIVGLSSKPLHSFGKPTYQCEWLPNLNTSKPTSLSEKTIGTDLYTILYSSPFFLFFLNLYLSFMVMFFLNIIITFVKTFITIAFLYRSLLSFPLG